MHEKVKEFLEAKKAEERKLFEENKQKTLIELGLFEKEYAPDNKYTLEYSFSEWDTETSTNKWYKCVATDVTDEEYAEIIKYSNTKAPSTQNPVATALIVIAWLVFVGGFIAGIALGNVEVVKGSYYPYTDTEFSFAIAFTYWCVALISGTMFLGFAEIIKLLHNIARK